MKTRFPPRFDAPPLDMTLDGQFREPPSVPVAVKLGRYALLVAVVAAAGAGALLALWFALALIPIAVGAALVAWGALRYQQWRGRGPFARYPTRR
jgi:hypothetical protein